MVAVKHISGEHDHATERRLGGDPFVDAEMATLLRSVAAEVGKRVDAQARAGREMLRAAREAALAVCEAEREAARAARAERGRRIRERFELQHREKEALARLPTIAELHGLVLTNEVPRTRAECPDTSVRPCGAWRCRFSLLRTDEPPGRPGLANVPRDENGRTLRVVGDFANGTPCEPRPDATAWVQIRPRPSCALDVAEATRGEGLSNGAIGAILGNHRTGIARIVKRGLAKLKAAGVTMADLELLRRQEQERRSTPAPSERSPLATSRGPRREATTGGRTAP